MYKGLIVAMLTVMFSSVSLYAQKIDYQKSGQHTYLANCGTDSLAIFKALPMLKRVDRKTINKNLDVYYNDLGIVYYKMGLITHTKKYMDTAVINYKKAIKINDRNQHAIWDCAVALVFSQHCKEGLKYIDMYIKTAPANEIDSVAIGDMRRICRYQ
jgi:hypothetical protein